MTLIITNVYIFVMALVLAVLEIQIEGRNGWAKDLPTWRPSPDTWYAQLYARLMFKKRLTGYHNVILFGVQTLFICILSIVILNVKTKLS
jgi:hypothetical protein